MNTGCAGLCVDVEKRRIGIAVAVDSVEMEEGSVTFTDIDHETDTPRRLPNKGERGIVVIDGIQKVVATDHCMAVCCTDLAMFLMDGRWNVREMLTKGLVATEWPVEQKSLMSNYGKRENLAKATMEVEVAQLISND